jgi:hypothetical protein
MIMQKAERKRGFEWRVRLQYKRKDSRIILKRKESERRKREHKRKEKTEREREHKRKESESIRGKRVGV